MPAIVGIVTAILVVAAFVWLVIKGRLSETERRVQAEGQRDAATTAGDAQERMAEVAAQPRAQGSEIGDRAQRLLDARAAARLRRLRRPGD